jgi:hypothetical protein
MEDIGEKTKIQEKVHSLTRMMRFSWIDLIGCVWQVSKLVRNRLGIDGIYEVLDYETTLEINDRNGTKATVNKQQKVRYLQDHIIAYQDQAWGDGEILVDYKCSPGIPVDQYRFGHKTIILISLRKERNKGCTDEYNIQWGLKDSFVKDVESWATVIQHCTKKLRVRIIFPADRPPIHVTLIESRRRKRVHFEDNAKKQLPDGRWQVIWERVKPKLYEEYILEWKW